MIYINPQLITVSRKDFPDQDFYVPQDYYEHLSALQEQVLNLPECEEPDLSVWDMWFSKFLQSLWSLIHLLGISEEYDDENCFNSYIHQLENILYDEDNLIYYTDLKGNKKQEFYYRKLLKTRFSSDVALVYSCYYHDFPSNILRDISKNLEFNFIFCMFMNIDEFIRTKRLIEYVI